MSFADLPATEAGYGRRTATAPLTEQQGQRSTDPDIVETEMTRDKTKQVAALANSISRALQALSAEMGHAQRLLGSSGTLFGHTDIQSQISSVLESCRKIVRDASHDLHTLNEIDPQLAGDEPTRFTQRKLSHDFQQAISRFQNLQKVAAKKQREELTVAKNKLEESEHPQDATVHDSWKGNQSQRLTAQEDGSDHAEGSYEQQPLQQKRQLLSESEIALNESLIAERESEIRDIETGINELNEIFRKLGSFFFSLCP